STSNCAPLGSADTSMVERAGYGSLKYSAITALTTANCDRSVRYRPTRATSSSEPPPAWQTARRVSKARRAWAARSPGTSAPVAGSSGIWPERKTVLPARVACEYGPIAAGASPVRTGCLGMRDILATQVAADYDRPAPPPPWSAGLLALHAMDHAQPAHLADHVGQVGAIAHFDGELDHRDVGIALQVLHRIDVGVGLGDCRRHLRQHARAVLDLEAQRNVVVAADLAVPADVDPAFGRLAVLGHVRALDPMHHHATPGGVVTHDVVARDRHAAVGEGQHATFGAGDQDAVLAVRARACGILAAERLRHVRRHPVAKRDIGQQGL